MDILTALAADLNAVQLITLPFPFTAEEIYGRKGSLARASSSYIYMGKDELIKDRKHNRG